MGTEKWDTLDRVQGVFDRVTGNTDIALVPNMNIYKDLDVNSFAFVQLVCEIEREFGVSVPNSALRSFKTVKNILDFLEKAG